MVKNLLRMSVIALICNSALAVESTSSSSCAAAYKNAEIVAAEEVRNQAIDQPNAENIGKYLAAEVCLKAHWAAQATASDRYIVAAIARDEDGGSVEMNTLAARVAPYLSVKVLWAATATAHRLALENPTAQNLDAYRFLNAIIHDKSATFAAAVDRAKQP